MCSFVGGGGGSYEVTVSEVDASQSLCGVRSFSGLTIHDVRRARKIVYCLLFILRVVSLDHEGNSEFGGIKQQFGAFRALKTQIQIRFPGSFR